MSSISSDTYIEALGVDLETITDYTPDQLQDLIEAKIANLNPADQATFQENLRLELEEKGDGLKALENQTEDVLRDSSREQDYTRMAEAERILSDLADLSTVIDSLDTAIIDAYQYNAFTNVSTDQDYNFTYNSGALDDVQSGDTVTITATGTSGAGGSLFESLAGSSNDEGMVDKDGDGVKETKIDADHDGVADFDVNADGFIDRADLDAAQTSRDPATGQQVFIDINPGDQCSLAGYDEATKTATFKIITTEGEEFFLKVAGDVNLKFYGTDYFDLNQIKETWPHELAYRSWDGTDTVSFGQHLFDPEISDADRMNAVGGYQEVKDGLSTTIATVQGYLEAADQSEKSTVGKLSKDAQKTLTDMIELLYATRDSASGKTVEDAWQEIYAMLTGKSEADQAALMGALIFSIAQNDPGNMTGFFATQNDNLQTIINWAALDASDNTNMHSFDKLITIILNEQIGTGSQYPEGFVATVFSPDGKTQGKWKDNTENVEALEWYEDLMLASGVPASAEIQTALKNEAKIAGVEANTKDAEKSANDKGYSNVISFSADDYRTMKDKIDPKDTNLIYSGISETNYKNSIIALMGLIKDGGSVPDLSKAIVKALDAMDDSWDGDVAGGFVYYLHKTAPDLLLSLCAQEGWADIMAGIIKGDKEQTNTMADALEILSDTMGKLGKDRNYGTFVYGAEKLVEDIVTLVAGGFINTVADVVRDPVDAVKDVVEDVGDVVEDVVDWVGGLFSKKK